MANASADVVGELMRVTAGLRRASRRRVAAAIGVAPLPEAQREILLLVSSNPGIGVAAAAKELDLAGNSVSTLVNTLVRAGLLVRDVDAFDRRAARLDLTDAGRARLSAWRSARSALLGAALDRAGADDRRAIEAALPALRRLLDDVRDDSYRAVKTNAHTRRAGSDHD